MRKDESIATAERETRPLALRNDAGLTLIELVVTVAIIMVLAVAALPLAKVSLKRSREIELKRNLRTIRRALDDFHKSYLVSQMSLSQPGGRLPGRASNVEWSSTAPGARRNTRDTQGRSRGLPGAPQDPLIPGVQENEAAVIPIIDVSRFDPIDSKGYPPDLEILVEGVPASGNPDDKVKFLRRIPKDPMVPEGEWGLRSYQDRPDAQTWGRQNVYDVYTKSTGMALDGSHYRDW